jgi:hypothetical protein
MNKRQKTITTNDQVLIDEKSLFLWIYTGYRKKKEENSRVEQKKRIHSDEKQKEKRMR